MLKKLQTEFGFNCEKRWMSLATLRGVVAYKALSVSRIYVWGGMHGHALAFDGFSVTYYLTIRSNMV